MAIQVTNSQARRLFMQRQGLCDNPARKQNKAELLELIERIGFVQVDSINAVERAHHMILFSRNQTYQPKHLSALLEKDRSLFENWTHDASVIPTAFYPYWMYRFLQTEPRLLERWRKWRREGFEETFAEVLNHIKVNGPTRSRDMKQPTKKKGSSGWWDWHPSKTALEFLWRTGKLSVDRREGFQKVYDITERIFSPDILSSTITEEDFVDWSCNSALDKLGFASSGEIAAFWDGIKPAEAKAWCEKRKDRMLIEVEITSVNGGKPHKAFAKPETLDLLSELPDPPKRVRVLSPFDPLIRDRKRMERLFNYHYRIEVFVPEAKRQYGYYVFPLLEGDKLIGRIDMKRQAQNLLVKGLWFEPGIKHSKGRLSSLESELERIRQFVKAEQVTFEDGYMRQAS